MRNNKIVVDVVPSFNQKPAQDGMLPGRLRYFFVAFPIFNINNKYLIKKSWVARSVSTPSHPFHENIPRTPQEIA